MVFSNGGSISQTLAASVLPDSIYTLSVFVGDRKDGLYTNNSINLIAGSTTLCTFSGSNASASPSAAGNFVDETCSFTSGATGLPPGNLSIVLTSGGQQTQFDDVSLTVVSAPEPGSLALLSAGFLCVGLLFTYLKRKQHLQPADASRILAYQSLG